MIYPATETGSLGIPQLKRIWSSTLAQISGAESGREGEHKLDRLVLDALGLGLHQTYSYLFSHAPSFEQFEDWIVHTAGEPSTFYRLRLDRVFSENAPDSNEVEAWLQTIERMPPVLSEEDLEFWSDSGYVIVRNAVPPQSAAAASRAVWEFTGAQPDDPRSWYPARDGGIMVDLIQHPALDANRQSSRIHKAFSQVWNTPDLWVTADRCGFHPPQTSDHPFQGPDLHWDLDLSQPPRFATQGILYLEDTPADQGAFTLVPGFHKRFASWLRDLDPAVDPQQQDLHALGSRPVEAKAGDMIIWHNHLPHGSRPNLGKRPRIVQYINMYPADLADA